MRRQYSVKRGVRPRDIRRSDHGAAASARLFMCAGCHAQALICSCCDRGQIYCAGDCAVRARRTGRDARRRYQTSRRGRLALAERSRRYRVRCKNVTHHGSPPSPSDNLLSFGSPAIASDAAAFVRRHRPLEQRSQFPLHPARVVARQLRPGDQGCHLLRHPRIVRLHLAVPFTVRAVGLVQPCSRRADRHRVE
jgi:hypothetical protein